jgi:TolB protein
MIGKRINQYEIIEILGSGNMGVVYKGWDHQLKRDVAIKVMQPDVQIKGLVLENFERAARTSAGLIHPNIVSVIDFGIESGMPYLVMEHIPGKSLKGHPTIPLDWERAIQKLIPVARALKYAHHEGISHQGVNLANLMVTEMGDLILTDFGITRLIASELSSPKIFDPRDDIDHLAIVLYEMIAGEDIDLPELSQEPDKGRIRELNLPEAIEQLFLKAFDEDSEKRYQSMGEFIQTLEDLVSPSVGLGCHLSEGDMREALEDEWSKKEHGSASKAWIPIGAVILFFALIGVVCFSSALWGVFQFKPSMLARNLTPTKSPTAESTTPTLTQPESSPLTISKTADVFPPTETQMDTSQLLAETPVPLPSSTLEPTISLTPTPLGGGGLIAFHSDRSGNNDIYVMEVDGSDVRQLTNETADDRAPSWSPDGGSIAYKSNIDGDYEIYILDLLTGYRWQVTNNDCNDHSPVWSPDGRQFVFYSECDGNREIYVIDADGENRTQLTDTSGVYNWFAVWSPDGRQIAFASNRNGKYQIHLMNADGSNQRLLADGCVPFFSPDGETIVFNQYCTDSGNVFVMSKDGSNVQAITEAPMDNNRNPSWSADGRKIVFQSEQSGNFEIWMMDADGSNWVQLTNHTAKDVAPVWQPSVLTWNNP